jgi:hypothetical protein
LRQSSYPTNTLDGSHFVPFIDCNSINPILHPLLFRLAKDSKTTIFNDSHHIKIRFSETALLGETTYDIFLNDTAYWSNVPARVWDYTIGGYQVIKKWLSYREQVLLERPLKPEEARYVTEMVRRIAALLLLEPALDDNYRAVAAAARSWTA